MTLKIKTINTIDVGDWDNLVTKTYGRPYNLQQQDGCMGRGIVKLVVPLNTEDYENDTLPEEVNGSDMGVSFEGWVARDPKKPLCGDSSTFSLELWWERNFYPDKQMLANDLYHKGLLPMGEYSIIIDW